MGGRDVAALDEAWGVCAVKRVKASEAWRVFDMPSEEVVALDNRGSNGLVIEMLFCSRYAFPIMYGALKAG